MVFYIEQRIIAVKYAFRTDRGIKRKTNQDACVVFSPAPEVCVAVVCDGIGGGRAGDVASELAVRTVSDRIRAGWRDQMPDASVRNLMLTSINAANFAVVDAASAEPSFSGMGTTIVAAVLRGNALTVAHVGDSRAYVCGDALRRLTKDHSLVQAMVDEGVLSDEEAERHPKKNYITRALGIEDAVDVDFTEETLLPEERVLLCTDGLSNYVSGERLFEMLRELPVESLPDSLIDEANRNGGGDNITAAVIAVR